MTDKTDTSVADWLDYLMGLISSATFGLTPLLNTPVLSQGVSGGAVLMYRSLIAMFTVDSVVVIHRESLRVSLRSLLILLTLPVLYFFSSFLLIEGYQYMPLGVATVLHFSYPVFTALLMFLVFRQRISVPQGLIVLLTLNGASPISGLSESDVTAISLRPLLTVLFSGSCHATYIIILRHACLKPISSFKLATHVMGPLTIFFAFLRKVIGASLLLDNEAQWIYTALLVSIPTARANITLVWAVQRIGPTSAATVGVLEPLTAVIVGAFALDEKLSLGQGISIGIVLMAVLLLVISPLLMR